MVQVLTKPMQEGVAREVIQRFVKPSLFWLAGQGNEALDSLPVVDVAAGALRIGGEEAAAEEMLAMLIKTLPEVIERVQSAYHVKDFVKLQFVVHQFHGGLCYCGAPRLRAAAKWVLDVLLKANLKEGLELDIAYGRLYKEMGVLLQAYDSLKK